MYDQEQASQREWLSVYLFLSLWVVLQNIQLPPVTGALALSLPTPGHSAQDFAWLHVGAFGWGPRGALFT